MNPEIDFGIVLVLIAVFLLFRKVWRATRKRGKVFVTVVRTRRHPVGFDVANRKWVYSDDPQVEQNKATIHPCGRKERNVDATRSDS